jgi:Cu+-exporting ATPase
MATTVHDPVCGMDIDPATAAGTSEYKGQTYYFCSLVVCWINTATN